MSHIEYSKKPQNPFDRWIYEHLPKWTSKLIWCQFSPLFAIIMLSFLFNFSFRSTCVNKYFISAWEKRKKVYEWVSEWERGREKNPNPQSFFCVAARTTLWTLSFTVCTSSNPIVDHIAAHSVRPLLFLLLLSFALSLFSIQYTMGLGFCCLCRIITI